MTFIVEDCVESLYDRILILDISDISFLWGLTWAGIIDQMSLLSARKSNIDFAIGNQ